MSLCGADNTETCVQTNLAIVESLLFIMLVTFLDVVDLAPLQLASALLQDFLHALHHWCRPFAAFSAIDSLYSGVSDFVDDWSIGPWATMVCLFLFSSQSDSRP